MGLGSELGARGSGPRARGKLGARSSALGTWSSGLGVQSSAFLNGRVLDAAGKEKDAFLRSLLPTQTAGRRLRSACGSARLCSYCASAWPAAPLGLRLGYGVFFGADADGWECVLRADCYGVLGRRRFREEVWRTKE